MNYIEPRPISPTELQVLQTVLIRASLPGTPVVTDEALNNLIVYSKCDCGCASIGFLPKGIPASASTKTLADGLGLSPENEQIGIFVHGSLGQIVELELYWHHTEGAPLPRPETIAPWEGEAELI